MTADHRHILVVDDEPQITRVLRTSLASQGYDIRVANDGETALEIVKDWTPDRPFQNLFQDVAFALKQRLIPGPTPNPAFSLTVLRSLVANLPRHPIPPYP